MKNLPGGIDVGSEQHHVIIMNDKEEILYDREVAHKFSEFYEAIEEFRKIEVREKVAITFAMEGKNGYGSPFDMSVVSGVVSGVVFGVVSGVASLSVIAIDDLLMTD